MDLSELFAVIYLLREPTLSEFEYMLGVIAALRFSHKDKIPPCSLREIDFSSEPLMDGWHYFYHCNIISPRGLCLCGVYALLT